MNSSSNRSNRVWHSASIITGVKPRFEYILCDILKSAKNDYRHLYRVTQVFWSYDDCHFSRFQGFTLWPHRCWWRFMLATHSRCTNLRCWWQILHIGKPPKWQKRHQHRCNRLIWEYILLEYTVTNRWFINLKWWFWLNLRKWCHCFGSSVIRRCNRSDSSTCWCTLEDCTYLKISLVLTLGTV